MKKIAFLMLISLPAWAENSLEQFRIVEQGGSGLSTLSSGISCFHDSDNSVSMCVYTNDTQVTGMAPPNATTDVNAGNTTIHSENVWPGAAGAKTAGNLVLAGGLDSKTLVFDEASPKAGTCPGTTLTLTVNGTDNTLTFNTICPGAGDCTTKAAACVAYAAAIEALSGVGATCSTETVYVTADQPATVSIVWSAETATCTTYSNGTDGCVAVAAKNAPMYLQSVDGAGHLHFGTTCGGSNIYLHAGNIAGTTLQATTAFSGSTLGTVDILGVDDWYDSTAMSSDATPTPVHTITGKPIYSGVADPTNGTGGSVVIAPSPGERTHLITNVANLAGDTLTIVTCDLEGACTAGTVITEGAGAGQVNCVAAGLTTAECALAYKTLLDAHATLGPALVVSCLDATCSNSKFGLFVTPGTTSYVSSTYASGGSVGLTVTSGADGQVLIGDGSSAVPSIAFMTEKTSGFYRRTAATIGSTSSLRMSGYVMADSYMISPYLTAGNGAAGRFQNYPQTITCADSADGNHSTCGGASTISSNVVQLVCEDADGCTLTLAETNYSATVTGNVVIHGPAANHVDVADSATVLELAGGAAFAMDAADTLSISYSPLLYWAETARAAN